MLLKLSKLYLSRETLTYISTQKMEGRLAYAFGRNMREVDPDIAMFQSEWDKLIIKHGSSSSEDSNNIVVTTNAEAWKKEAQILLDTEIEINILKIKYEDLNQLSLTPSEAESISWMIEE